MSQPLRKRTNSPISTSSTGRGSEIESKEDFPRTTRLDAQSLLNANPNQHGVVLKLRVPFLYSLFPTFLQKCISSYGNKISWLPSPRWEQRYLIVLGSFLYKFKNEVSSHPKGTPIALESISVDYIDVSLSDARADLLPPNYECIFLISTFKKKHYYAVQSREEAQAWVNSLRQAQQEVIKRNMGHAGNMPYPSLWEYIDNLGRKFKNKKERINARVEELNQKDLEMKSFMIA